MQNRVSILLMLEAKREYSNSNNVNIYLADDGKIEMFCAHPHFNNAKEYISLELYCQYQNFSLFASNFSINHTGDLDLITATMLAEDYENNNRNVEIYCMIDDLIFGGSLRFKKNHDGLFAADDITEEYHQVDDSICNVDDFIKYTCKYFLLTPSFPLGNAEMRKN